MPSPRSSRYSTDASLPMGLRALSLVCVLLMLVLFGIAGSRLAPSEVPLLAAWGLCTAACVCLPARAWRGGSGRALFAAALAGFAFNCQVGAAVRPPLGVAGAAAFHLLSLGAYGLYLAIVIWRGAKTGRFAEDFLKVDLWVLNVGMVACVAVFFVRCMSIGAPGMAEILSAARQSLLPLSLVAAFLVALRSGGGAVAPRWLAFWAVLAMVAAVVASFMMHRFLMAAGA